MITAAKYVNEAHTQVELTLNGQKMIVDWDENATPKTTSWMLDNIQRWLDVPNTITAWTDPVDYMALMRSERDRRLADIDWRILRNYTQVAHSETPTDDATKMAAIYAYQKDLRDMPENNPNTTTKALYDALVWPNKPE